MYITRDLLTLQKLKATFAARVRDRDHKPCSLETRKKLVKTQHRRVLGIDLKVLASCDYLEKKYFKMDRAV